MVENFLIMESRVEQHREFINSLRFLLSESINKSLMDDVSYNAGDLNIITKTGKEIKEKLEDYWAELTGQVVMKAEELKNLQENIEVEPGMNFNHTGNHLSETMKIFDYPTKENSEPEIRNKMTKYNNCIHSLTQTRDEMKRVKTIINNIDEKKKVRLPLNIASKLGF